MRCEDAAERWAPPRLSGALGRSSGTGLSGAPPAGLEPRARGRPAAAPSGPPAGLRARRCPRGGSSASTERTGSAASLRHERSDSCSPSPAVLGEAAEARRREGGGVLAAPHGCPSPAQPQLCAQWLQTRPALPSPRAPHPYTCSLLPGARRAQQRFGCCLSCRVTWAPAGAFGWGRSCISPYAGVEFNNSCGSLPAQKIPWFYGTLKVPHQESDICSHPDTC